MISLLRLKDNYHPENYDALGMATTIFMRDHRYTTEIVEKQEFDFNQESIFRNRIGTLVETIDRSTWNFDKVTVKSILLDLLEKYISLKLSSMQSIVIRDKDGRAIMFRNSKSKSFKYMAIDIALYKRHMK